VNVGTLVWIEPRFNYNPSVNFYGVIESWGPKGTVRVIWSGSPKSMAVFVNPTGLRIYTDIFESSENSPKEEPETRFREEG